MTPSTDSIWPFRFCLNTSTITGQGLSVVDQILLAERCGHDGVEIWMRSIHEHLDAGGSVAETADTDRVLPGDGAGPIDEILRMLADKPSPPVLSIELFNLDLWQEPAEDAATSALDSMRTAVQRALR